MADAWDLHKRLDELVPVELRDEYCNDAAVHAFFQAAARSGGTRESALIAIIKSLVATSVQLKAAYMEAAALTSNVLHFEGPPPTWFVPRACGACGRSNGDHSPACERIGREAERQAREGDAPPGSR
jgi:hypothetical protein